jgi:hypothetical protein
MKIKDLIGMDAPPLLDYGSQLCLPYLLKQGCWSTCNHANTHNYALTAAEKTRVINYLQSQMQKLHPANKWAAQGQHLWLKVRQGTTGLGIQFTRAFPVA